MVALNKKVALVQSSPNLLNTTVEKNILVNGEAMQDALNLVGLNNIADKECGPRGLGLTLE